MGGIPAGERESALADRLTVEKETALLHEIEERKKTDPLHLWEPTQKQRPYINAVLHGPTQENWFIAANRAGKSQALAYCVAHMARYGTPEKPNQPVTIWVVSLDANTARDILQPKLFDNGMDPTVTPFIPDREIAEGGWKISDQILKLKNGSTIGFKNCESGRVKMQGVERDIIAIDEEPPETIYDELGIRIGAGRKLRIFGAVTLLPPEGTVGGVTWMFPKIIQPWKQGHKPGIGLFSSSIYDNNHISREQIAVLESKYPAGSVQRRIRLNGEWLPGLSGARMYAAFSRELHVRPQPAIQPRRPLIWTWDFNVEPMVSLVGQKEGNVFRVLREFVLDEGQISEMVDWFRSAYASHNGEIWIYGDATGKRRTNQTGQSDYQLIMNHMRNYGSVRLKVPEDNPHVRDRVNAVNRAFKNEFGEQCVEIDPQCTELIADLEQVISDATGGIKKTSNRKDPYYRRTHTSDAFGYWISHDSPVRSLRPTLEKGSVKMHTPGYWSKK